MATWIIRQAQQSDEEDLAEMRSLLWPDTSLAEQRREIHAFLNGTMAVTPAANLVAQDGSGRVIGFLEVDLRSHADGCDPAQPVGYIEGWFVREQFRARGVGRALVQAAEDWARKLKCLEMASDVLIDNDGSQKAHAALGYEVVDRCVHYRKAL
jgi:aminoglycoside 6'-N-acetyltransferase I